MFVPLGLVSWFFRILHILTGHEPTREHECHRVYLDPHAIRSLNPDDIALEIVRGCIKEGRRHKPGTQEEVILPPILQPRRGTKLCEHYADFPKLLEQALNQEGGGRFKIVGILSDTVIFERI